MTAFNYEPIVTDVNDDGSPAYTYEPWTDGHAIGFKVTRHADDKVGYVYLNPSTETWSDGDYNPDVFVYTGVAGTPDQDESHHFYNIEFEAAPEDIHITRESGPRNRFQGDT